MACSRRKFLVSLAALTAGAACPSWAAEVLSGSSFALSGPLFTGQGTRLVLGQSVLVSGGLIEDIVPADNVADRPVIPVVKGCILPGIINSHVHRVHTPGDRRDRYLEQGVTSIGDAGSPLNVLPDLIESPVGRTVTAGCAGPMLCPPGGYPLPVHTPDHALVVRSPAHARECVRFLADHGVTTIKFAMEPGPYSKPWPVFEQAVIDVICNEAQRLGLVSRCHVEDCGYLDNVLQSGVNTVEHVPHRWMAGGRLRPILQPTATGGGLVSEYQRLLEKMVDSNVILTPTLDVLSRSIWNGRELIEPVRAFVRSGGMISVGNDHPYRRTDAGMPLREMELLAKAGTDRSAILRGATSLGARAANLPGRGIIAPGMHADLLVVAGNPLDDLAVLASPVHIIKDGVFVR